MNINFDELLSAGTDYLSSTFEFRSRYHGGVYVTPANPDCFRRYHYMERQEHALDTLQWVLGIPQNVIINAARIENRYYERGGEGCISSEALIRGLLRNSDCPKENLL